jgi:hypothetical protein
VGYTKTLSLRVSLLILFSCFLFKPEAKALSLYGGGSYSFGGVVAESEFYNGASDWAPGLVLGMQWGRLGTEAFFRKFDLQDDFEQNGVVYNMSIDNVVWGLGFRIAIHSNIDFLLGMNSQTIKATSTSSNPNLMLTGLLNESYMKWYVGGGVKGEIYPNVIARFDLAYYQGDIEFGLFGLDFSVVYRFATF